jgi:formamidopyrimidine-DNA glycosylase
MPELPEVETVAARLREGKPGVLGRTVASADVDWAKTIAEPSSSMFKKRIVGQKIMGIGRRAKFIQFNLSQDTLLVHLRMSGDLLAGKSPEPLTSHVRFSLLFQDGYRMDFTDPRKFGRAWLLGDPAVLFDELGPEPLDESLTAKEFHGMLAARKRQLKPLLLDQKFLAGLGNIYADESLNLARLHPLRSADSLTTQESGALLKAIRSVLNEGIRRNGASIDWVYRGGDFQNHFRVYQRTGEPCPRCGTPISRTTVGQRGTHFCPNCQVQAA